MNSTSKTHKLRTLQNSMFMYRFALREAPLYFWITVIYWIAHSALIFFEYVWSTKMIIEAIQYGQPFSVALFYIGLIAGLVSLKLLFSSFYYHWFLPKARSRIYLSMRRELMDQAARLDLACYDNPGFYDDFVWSVNEAPNRFDNAMDLLGEFLMAVTSLLITGVFILFNDPVGMIFMAASTVLSLVVESRLSRAQYEMDQEALPHRRKWAYFSRIFYLPDHAKEIRLTPVAQTLSADFDQAASSIEEIIKKKGPRQVVLGFLSSFLFSRFLIQGLYVSWLVIQTVVYGRYSYGTMLALFNSVSRATESLKDLVGQIPAYQKLSLYVEKIRTFLAIKPGICAPAQPQPLPKGPWVLEFRQVWFRYPSPAPQAATGTPKPASQETGHTEAPAAGTEARPLSEPAWILQDINLTIRQGERLALVGHNGAGKTSLTKLIMRLYDPSSGSICLNGKDIREFDPQAYRALVSTVFQDFQIFAATLGENVLLSRVQDEAQCDAVLRALKHSGFDRPMEGPHKGIHQELTREFDPEGQNLSGGEAQKVAVARVFAKESRLYIMDEPSSALDPESEYKLNKTMETAAGDKALVFISHRLSSTRMASRILLLQGGRITEEGTHDELMAQNGSYRTIFDLQSERYRPVVRN